MARALTSCLALAAVAAGCGTSKPATTADVPFTATQIAAFANSVAARPGDVPGFQTSRLLRGSPARASSGPLGPNVERCDGGVAAPTLVSVRARALSRHPEPRETLSLDRIEIVRSTLYVFPRAAEASAELATLGSARARDCVKQYLASAKAGAGEVAGPSGPPYSYRAVSVLPWALPGWAAGLSWTFGASKRDAMHVDHLWLVKGPALIDLDAIGPFSAAMERRLLDLLNQRAQKQSLG
jgi:hypothetical protein